MLHQKVCRNRQTLPEQRNPGPKWRHLPRDAKPQYKSRSTAYAECGELTAKLGPAQTRLEFPAGI